MNGLIVNIKRLHPDAVVPRYATELAAGFDLVAVDDVIIAPGETKLIPLGFAIEIPQGLEMQIRDRSGIASKTKLRVANSPGTVDGDFRGEVAVIVDNIALPELFVSGNERGWMTIVASSGPSYDVSGAEVIVNPSNLANTYLIRKGDRICQGVITPIERVTFAVVAELSETERGAGGFGSSGIRAEVNA